MKIDLRKAWTATALTIRQFPVETGIILYAFVATSLVNEKVITAHETNLLLIPLFFALAYILNQLLPAGTKSRWPYFVCWIPLFPLWLVNPESWVFSPAYVVSVALCFLGVLACRRRSDNTAFVSEAVRYLLNAFVALVFAGVAHLLLLAIFFSVSYIFNVFESWHDDFLIYSSMAAYIVVSPLLFLTFTGNNLSRSIPANRMLDALLNYIFTPALLIYTAILYIYFIKITLTWSLPKGGLAYMIFAFAMAAMVCKACQPLLSRRIYDFYFRHFSLIALPAVAMFWIGSLHRVGEYGLTEDRVYLLLCGVIMTVMLAMFFTQRSGRYLYATTMVLVVLGLFTYIPPLSAKNLAIRSQSARVYYTAQRVGLLDEKGNFIMKERPLSDTVYKKEYRRMFESLQYLSDNKAPLFGLDLPEDLWGLLPSKAYAVIDEKTEYSAKDIWVSNGMTDLDISGYTRMVRFYGSSPYQYDKQNDTLYLSKNGKRFWSIPYTELLDRQLEKIGYSPDHLPGADTIRARSTQFLSLKTDTFLLVFSHISMTRTGNELRIQDFLPEYILVREQE